MVASYSLHLNGQMKLCAHDIPFKKTHKWVDILDKLMYNYNHSYHRSIKMTPFEASKKKNIEEVDNNLFGDLNFKVKPSRFKIGDKVRINKYKSVFSKGYLPNYTNEVFVISEILHSDKIPSEERKIKEPLITYKIKDLKGEDILGIFYDQELVLYNK